MGNAKKMEKKLRYERKNFWEISSEDVIENAFEFAKGYKVFLDKCKTEREAINYATNFLKENGFEDAEESNGGKKLYKIFHGKTAAIAIIGKKPVSYGVNLIVSHVDAPRVDLMQDPLYEDGKTKLGVMRTHYYGGIKKYQWMSTPLALHGTIIKSSGEIINVVLGEGDDPVLVMPDLLPHLAAKQYAKKLGEAVDASRMNIIFNSIPFKTSEEIKEKVKFNALYLLNKKYDIVEEDILSAELEIVPAGKARDAGLDGSFILGYGQDDRICAYTSLMALKDLIDSDLEKTAIIHLADKEEIGSESNTGAKSAFIIDFIGDLLKANGEKYDSYTLRKTLMKTQVLSADVNAAINPNFPEVHEASNAVHVGFGISVTKFTGARGKSGSNEANAEFNAKLIKIFNDAKVNWQIGALGKVDEGGGGTIAKYMAEYGCDVIDCGPGVLGMHSLYELTSKADIYSSYQAYKAFLEKG